MLSEDVSEKMRGSVLSVFGVERDFFGGEVAG